MFDSKQHWQNIYQTKSSFEVSWHQENPKLSMEFIHNANLQPNDPIIDVGGGASVLVDFLCSTGFTNLSVLDISRDALAISKKRLGPLAQTISWYETNIMSFNPRQKFSLWHDRAVFHFLLDPSDRKDYVNVLKQALDPGGQLVISAFALDGPAKCSGLDIVQYDFERLSAELGSEFKLLEKRSETHITPSQKEQKFTYFRFIRLFSH